MLIKCCMYTSYNEHKMKSRLRVIPLALGMPALGCFKQHDYHTRSSLRNYIPNVRQNLR